MTLARNAAFNLGGALLPAAAALLTVPVLISHLGTSNYGVLILVTSIVGYFAILDINATAGSVKFIAEYRAKGQDAKVQQVISFGGALYLGIGVVGGGLIAAFAEPLASHIFKVPADSRAEATLALRWAGAAFLAGQLQAYFQSVPQALERYDLTGRLEAVFGTLVSVVSMAVAWAGGGLLGVVVARLLLSVVNIGFLLAIIRRILPGTTWLRPEADTVRAVASFSAYSYLTRLAAISAANADKLLIGALVDMRSLAYYSVPMLLVNRIYALAFRLAQVVFPRASALAGAGQQEQLRHTYLGATRYVTVINAGLLLLLVTLAPEVMHYWAGAEFGAQAVLVMVALSGAVFLDSLTNLPSLVNDGMGRPQITGVAAVVRAVAGLAAAWLAIRSHGIAGAAWAQFAVSLAGMLIFNAFVHRISLKLPLLDVLRHGWLPALPVAALAFALGALSTLRPVLGMLATAGALLALVAALLFYGWCCVLLPAHRQRLVAYGRGLAGRQR
jgi:O-antigen/teichoic acid export membrane protein